MTFVVQICSQDAKNRGDADGFEISYNRLKFEREVGHGAFGQVFLAKAEAIRGVPGTRLVAVKKLKGNLDHNLIVAVQLSVTVFISLLKRRLRVSGTAGAVHDN